MKNRLFSELGLYLKGCRKLAGVTQRELAEALGYSSPQFISNYERGLCAPAMETLPVITSICKADPERVITIYEQEIGFKLRELFNEDK